MENHAKNLDIVQAVQKRIVKHYTLYYFILKFLNVILSYTTDYEQKQHVNEIIVNHCIKCKKTRTIQIAGMWTLEHPQQKTTSIRRKVIVSLEWEEGEERAATVQRHHLAGMWTFEHPAHVLLCPRPPTPTSGPVFLPSVCVPRWSLTLAWPSCLSRSGPAPTFLTN